MKPNPTLSAFGLANSLSASQQMAERVEQAGFETLWIPEAGVPVFEVCTAAALAGTSLRIGTGVAVAFPRSPMLTAQAAWALSQATQGRFIPGLGTQIKPHVERRFSSSFSDPGPRMREYIEAMRAIYRAFRGQERLKFEGSYYNFSLLTPEWAPPALEFDDPPIYVAGVREWMCRMAGTTSDGLLAHPLSTRAYLDKVVVPALREGERVAGRGAGSVALVCPVMTAVSDDDAIRARQRENIRARLAFYGSTPGYDIVFDASGFEGVGKRLQQFQRQRDFAGLVGSVTDEMIDAMAITCRWDELADRLYEAYGDIADDIQCYSVVDHWHDEPDAGDRWNDVNRRFRDLVTTRS
jgi:probable F420-dependent oxidoreductase